MPLNAYSKRWILSEIYLHGVTVQRPSYWNWKVTFGLTLLHFLVLWSCRDTLFQQWLNKAFCALSSSFTLFPPLICYRIPTSCNLILFTLLFWFDATVSCLLPRHSWLPHATELFPQINHYFLLKLLPLSHKSGKQCLISWTAKLLGIQVFAAL